ncbi:hypothetical protein DYB35_003318 [Aphanomyces astaci]|uniref:RING-type domain-containing protein n=1 Tax=Aphanomyces astaci TaxID=112090 RepID=A0A3R7A7A7_APHAT|nr:hypothetical protein DYB35_003318 [Aphanomyces astaci]
MVVTITEQVIEAMSDYSQSNPRNSKLDQLLTFLRTIYRDKEHHHVIDIIDISFGTLSPLATTVKELGIPFPIQLENSHVIDPSQVWVGVVGTGVTGKKLNASYQSRSSPDYAAELGNTLVNITRLVPNGLLVFFPSYSILDQCTGQWQQLTGTTGSIWDRLGALKTIFVEPKNRVEFTGVVQAYHDAIRDNPTAGAIFFAVCRGKVSEGIDFSNENGRAVVITGLPFPPTKDPKIVLKKAINSSIVASRGAIILLDERFAYNQQKGTLSKWLQPHLLVHETRQLMTPTQVTAFISYMRDPRRYLPEIDALLDAYPSLRRHIAPMLPPRSVAHAMDQLNQLSSSSTSSMAAPTSSSKRKRTPPSLSSSSVASQPAATVVNPQCSICFDIVQTTSAPPCGHLCCVRCWQKLQLPDKTIPCPVCKQTFHADAFTRVVAAAPKRLK